MSLRIMYTLLLVVNYCVDVNYIELTMLSLVSHAFLPVRGPGLGPHVKSSALLLKEELDHMESPLNFYLLDLSTTALSVC